MVPGLFKWVKFLNTPIDFNLKWKDGMEFFGSHKTYRGFFFGILFAILVLWIQINFFPEMKKYWLIDYEKWNIFLLGFLFGFGALFGDLVKSFFKRRIKVKPGNSWPVFDQIDWVLGTLIFLTPIKIFSWEIYFYSILIWGLIHPVVNLIGYWLKLKKNKF